MPAGQELWSAITDQYDIDDAGGIALLKQICFAQDRVEQLGLLEKQTAPQRPRYISNQTQQSELPSCTCRVTTGRNEDVGRGAFFRFLPATSTHRYALTTNSFSVCATLCSGRVMPRYFFHLAGTIAAHDTVGHECVNDAEARDHGSFIAHRIGTERPEMAREKNSICVVNESLPSSR